MSLEKKKKKKELEDAIKNEDLDIKKIFDISAKIDEEILFQMKFNEYDKIVRNNDSRELINSIKQELSEHYYGMSEQELIIVSLNIFDYSYLKFQHISENDIVKYICTKNAIYYDILTDKDKKSLKVDLNLKYFKYLINKYTKIIENGQ